MLRVLELFAGIGACSKALERLGIEHEIVDAVEIDKYAIKSFNAVHGTNFDVQDITKWDKNIEVDLVMHGSPCQDFSVAGKQAGGDIGSGTRSSLMYETIRIVEKLKPKYVIWENVKNLLSKKHRHNFDAYLETMEELGYKNFYQVLNAKDYGIPQNRERVFTVSILGNEKYTFPESKELEKIPLDYLEENVDEKYYLSEEKLKIYQRNFGSKGQQLDLFKPISTLTASMGTGGGNVPYFEFPPKQELKLRLKDILENEVDEKYYLNNVQIEKIKTSNFMQEKKRIQNGEISDTLLARDWKDPKCVQVGNLEGGKWDKINESCRRVYSDEGLSPTIHTCQGGNTEPKVEVIGNYSPSGHDASRIVDSEGLAPTVKENHETVTATNKNYRIRKLTPKECWRLMGFDDEDFEKARAVGMSNTQLYKQAGNSIVVNVLEKILEKLI